MNQFTHPSGLNAYQLYQQVNKISKLTNRAKNPDWYADPFSVQRQWHLWLDGGQIVSNLFDRVANRWIEGPACPYLEGADGDESENLEELHKALAEALRSRELGGRVKSLGVIVHVADEFAVLDPAREYSSKGDFEEVQNLLLEQPREVLGDGTVDPLLYTWRLLPCWGVKEGKRNMALQMGRGREDFFTALRDYGEGNNIAIRAAGISAPLEALRLAPLYLEWEAGRGDIIVMLYRRFSALVVLNGEGELVLLRALSHRSGMEYPVGLGEILINTQTSTGLTNPVVSILPMSGDGAQEKVTSELTSFFAGKQPLDIGFIELDQIEGGLEIPGHRLEMLSGDLDSLSSMTEGKSLAENLTFTGLVSGWANQDFFPLEKEEEEKYPSWQDLQLRKWFGITKMVLLAAVVGLAGWGGLKVMRTVSTEAWKSGGEEPQAVSQGRAKMIKQQQQLDYWGAVMEPRSRGWLVMELLLDLFPQDSGAVITDCDYGITTIQSDVLGGKKATSVGFYRQWKITGFAKVKAAKHLNNLSGNAFMRKQFQALSERYEAGEFDMDVKGRTLNVTLQREQKAYPRSGSLGADTVGYNTGFTLVITQQFSAEDVLAMPVKMTAAPVVKK